VPPGEPVLARAGNVLRFTGRRHGCRAVIAFAGGIAVPEVLGSRATDVSAGFGGLDGRALRTGDRVALYEPPKAERARQTARPRALDDGPLRVILGPQDDACARSWNRPTRPARSPIASAAACAATA
jgi:antagonist of KipI